MATELRMNLVAFACLCVAIILLVPNFAGGKEVVEERQVNLEKRASQVQQKDDWRNWQWYLSNTAVSMNVKAAWQAGYTGKGILVAVVDDGVEINHPDLKPSVNLAASYDFLDNRNVNANYNAGSHGTKCAGIIAGGDNKKCGVGVAFDAQISSIRVLDAKTRSTDTSEAKGLSFKRDIIDIYSSSWGPGDMGWQVKGPGPQLRETLKKGTQLGRNGKGSIFVFSAGNGGIAGDSCAFNGYVNSIRTIAISTVNWDGSVPVFAEQCAAILAVTYGQDMFRFGNIRPPIVTVKGANDCTEIFPGSSGSAAVASGIIALVLQANPDLTWRDVQHLIARSSKPLNPPISANHWRLSRHKPFWRNNAAHLSVSSHFGFGLMDASKMIENAKEWHSVPPQLYCEVKLNVSNVNSSRLVIPSHGDLRLTLSLSENNCSIRYLEHMQAEVNLHFPRRGYLEMSSTSPSGTKSRLLYSRKIDSLTGYKNFTNWRVTSLHYWGETPIGDWNMTIRNARSWRNTRGGRVFGLKLILYGTKEDPLANNKHVDQKAKIVEAVNVSLRRQEIPIHGGYSQWSYWNSCSRKCGGGIQVRYRSCTNPRPENGGKDCNGLGQARESRKCNRHRCPVHGKYSPWGAWSQCDVTCGVGTKRRSRTCTNPAPAFNGRNCVGRSEQFRSCHLYSCPPVDGGYSKWTAWSHCSATCNSGTQRRNRSCTNPPPANGGKKCIGPDQETRLCRNSDACPSPGFPIHGGYSQWSPWSRCSKSCAGTQQRSRSCTSPSPQNGGRDCRGLGQTREARRCNTQRCQACKNGVFDGLCQYYSKNPGCSVSRVKKLCAKTCGSCQGFPTRGGFSQWSPWSRCSKSCAGGTQQRSRSCTSPTPQNGGRDCSGLGPHSESRTCNRHRCPACTNTASDDQCKEWLDKGHCFKNWAVRRLCAKTCRTCY